jgi:hypothetical protein
MSKVKVLSLFLISFLSIIYADPPFIPNIRAVNSADTINEGESCLALFGDNIYLICNVNERNRIPIIPFGKSTNQGLSWSPTFPFRDNSVGIVWHTDPVLLTDTLGYLHMFIQYSTTVIRHYLSTDGGNTWSETSEVSDRSTGGSVDKPWFVYYRGNIYGCWQEFGGSASGIRFVKSTDGGRTWIRSRADPSRTGITALSVDKSGRLYLVNVSGSSLYFQKSTDGGNTWTSPRYLSDVSYSSGYGDRAPLPSIAALENGTILLIWVDSRSGNWDILAKRSTDRGENWSATFTLNDSTAGGQCKGWVTTDPYDNFHIFYYHTPSWPTSSSSRWSIRYTYSTDGGNTFAPSIRITDTTFTSPVSFLGDYHTIVADSHKIYAAWADGRDGNLNLYFSSADLSHLGISGKEVSALKMRPFPSFLRKGEIEFSPELLQGNTIEVFEVNGRMIGRIKIEGEKKIKIQTKARILFFRIGDKVFKVVNIN